MGMCTLRKLPAFLGPCDTGYLLLCLFGPEAPPIVLRSPLWTPRPREEQVTRATELEAGL